MDVERAIRTQRVVRRFRDEPLADDDLSAILDAAGGRARRRTCSAGTSSWFGIARP
jgi:hypothetical protein